MVVRFFVQCMIGEIQHVYIVQCCDVKHSADKAVSDQFSGVCFPISQAVDSFQEASAVTPPSVPGQC